MVDSRPLDDDSPEARMWGKQAESEGTQYDRYAKRAIEPGLEESDHLAVLRGWSSTSPILDEDEECRGGGYFFRWGNKGIVLDPGHDFLRNFHSGGYHARLIHAVVVSHNHADHNQDLKPIDDLMYEMRKSTETPDGGTYSYALVWDIDTSKTKPFDKEALEAREERELDLKGIGHGDDPKVSIRQPHKLAVTFRPFRAEHTGDVPNATGIRIVLKDDKGEPAFTIGYTADTAYFPALGDNDKLGGCDLLIAHISQPDEEEYTDETHRKEVHLGYRGVINLLRHENIDPKLTIIGEFWAGLADLRIELVDGIRNRSGNKRVLPSSIGMRIDLPSLNIWCSKCGEPTDVASLRVAPHRSSLGPLGYLCKRCSL